MQNIPSRQKTYLKTMLIDRESNQNEWLSFPITLSMIKRTTKLERFVYQISPRRGRGVLTSYCARFSRPKRANECVHAHNERNFSQAKLHSEINVRLNEHGDLYFWLHNNSVHIILFNFKKKNKKVYGAEKRYRWKRAQNQYFGM